ncbi:putative nuclease HARBI1 [Pararge aegeria]|uniref:putative nuclease HARBI1 n=1 Tax=Pararge aegeria TaxID=116150 RepID=UPI0019CF9A3C|nr:putative nuclease HARBI1 [Pararge aegeria]
MDSCDASNQGYAKREELVKESQTIEMIGHIHADIFNQDKFLINGVEMRLKLVRSKDSFNLMCSSIDSKFKVHISSASLIMRKVRINPSVLIAHEKVLATTTAKYDSAENYRNRKSKFSFNVQVACDSQLRCLNIVARWPGSVHDQTIFNNSSLKQKFESGEFENGLLLGDSGYELKQYLLTPFLNPSSAAENLYNESHIRTRNTIERCFGVCKNRFPVLRRQDTLKLNKVQPIIVACFVLHNIAIDTNETDFGDNNDFDDDVHIIEDAVTPSLQFGNNPRSRLVQQYFLPLLNKNAIHNQITHE